MDRRPVLRPDESGQTTVEYATVIGLTVILLVLALAVVPADLFNSFWATLEGAL